ncbi:hypothetical protein [Enterococcus innesii]|uniref:hypothetical protein n=1 Tax=Enterococcus innesii TaxID=2839759 RepID=UPI003BEA722F
MVCYELGKAASLEETVDSWATSVDDVIDKLVALAFSVLSEAGFSSFGVQPAKRSVNPNKLKTTLFFIILTFPFVFYFQITNII